MKHFKLKLVVATISFLPLLALGGSALASEVTGNLSTGINSTVGNTVNGVVMAPPVASPVPGTYTVAQNVALSAPGASSIRYTTNGVAPSCSAGMVYSGSIAVGSSMTIEAISCYTEGQSSTVASYVYTINIPAPAPALSYSSGGGGGGGLVCNAVVAPVGGFKVGPGGDTTDRNVTLTISGGNALKMSVSNSPDFVGASIETYAATKAWTLTDGAGTKMVYVRFYNSCGVATNAVSVAFNYIVKPAPVPPSPQVLGTQTYADGTLLRGSNHRIYVVIGGKLVYISSLAQLRKYAGHEILKVDDSVIANWVNGSAPTVLGVQAYANGSLLRGPDHRIYVLTNGKLHYISSLKELAKYRGKKIYDVGAEVIAQYQLQ